MVRLSRQNRQSAAAFAAYLAISLVYFLRPGSMTRFYLGGGSDPVLLIWCLDWWVFAVLHHLNPFITHLLWYPSGFNLTWETSAPFLALAALPLTLIGGPVLAYNMLALLAPALAAWAAFLLARRLTNDAAAAAAGGYIFGFSSYELGQMLGHLDIAFTCLVPMAVLLCVMRVQDGLTRRRFVLALGLTLWAEMGIALEVLAVFCVLGAMGWGIFLACAPAPDRRLLWRLVPDIAAAAGLAALLGAPFLIFLVKGWNTTSPVPASAIQGFSIDPLNFVFPTALTGIGARLAAGIAGRFPGNDAERGAYLGLPLLMMLAWYFAGQVRRPYGRALLITFGALAVLSCGPWLRIAGWQTGVALPWLVLAHMPLLSLAIPARVTLYVSLAAAMAASLWLAQASGRRARFLLACLACLCLAPNARAYGWGPWTPWSAWSQAVFFKPAHVRQALGPAPHVMILPFGDLGDAMAWQIGAGFGFTLAGGYYNLFPRPEQKHGQMILQLFDGTAGPDFGRNLAAFCADDQVGVILLGPKAAPVQRAAIAALGWPAQVDGDFTVVRVPAATHPRPQTGPAARILGTAG